MGFVRCWHAGHLPPFVSTDRSEKCFSPTNISPRIDSGARIKKLGIARMQADDYLMINAIIWYTLLVISVNKTIFGGGSNFMTPEEEAALTPEMTRERVVGSRWVFVSEQAMILTIWSLKLCMLLIYRRLTYVSQHAIERLYSTAC